MIGNPMTWAGVGLVWVGVSLLVVLASRRARDRRAQRKRVAARRAAYRQGSAPLPHQAGWQQLNRAGAAMIPPAASVPPPLPPPSGGLYGTPRRDRDETSVMPRCPWGGDR